MGEYQECKTGPSGWEVPRVQNRAIWMGNTENGMQNTTIWMGNTEFETKQTGWGIERK